MGRIVTAEFDSGSRYAQIKNTIWQYDYGVTLRMTGLDLPAAVEVHFASVPSGGESETRIGVTQDGVTEVKIPNALLALHKTEDYRLYAFVYLTDADSGRTEYRAYMTVKARPKPGEQHPDTDEDHPLSDAVREVSAAAVRGGVGGRCIGGQCGDSKSGSRIGRQGCRSGPKGSGADGRGCKTNRNRPAGGRGIRRVGQAGRYQKRILPAEDRRHGASDSQPDGQYCGSLGFRINEKWTFGGNRT